MNKWTKVSIYQALEDWYLKTGEIPKADHWKRSGNHEHPSYQTVWVTFGGWRQAIDGWKRWRRRSKNWERSEIISAFQQWHKKYGVIPFQNDSQFNPELPSPSSVIRVFGSWNAAVEEAGFISFQRGLTRKAVERYLPMPRKKQDDAA